jgi:DNA primase
VCFVPLSDTLRARVDAVRERVDIADVVGAVVRLGRGGKPRGKCPFHGSKSDSFAIDPTRGSARCWGCDWSGDAIAFVRDFYSLSFGEALAKLESEHGLDGLAAAPARRRKVERAPRERDAVDSTVMGRWIWRHARPDHDAVRTYLRARRVPDAMLDDARLGDVRFIAAAPIAAWAADRAPDTVPSAPAMVALIRHAPDWSPIGVHVTYLSPDLAGKMVRKRRNGDAYPARKMLGASAGGGVLLGRYDDHAPLYIGEGLETVLSGMAIAGAGDDACGLAVLSLDNLQGHWRLTKAGALPIHDPQPDGDRAPAVAFARAGSVVGLIDADMKPLSGPRDRETDVPRGVPVVERRGGPVVRRAITSGERTELCAAMLVRAWRAHGVAASAMRPRMGLDFNDMMRVGE